MTETETTGPQKVRKRPVEIEAMPWDGTPETSKPIIAWVREHGGDIVMRCVHPRHLNIHDCDGVATVSHTLEIGTMEGTMSARPGWWILRGVKGEFYPCDPEVYAETYYPPGTADPAELLYLAWTVIANGSFAPPCEVDWPTAAADGSEWAAAAIAWRDEWHVFLDASGLPDPCARPQTDQELALIEQGPPGDIFIDIVFDGPPGPESGRFVEVEGPDGAGRKVGEWIDRGDGMWALRIQTPSPE